MRRWLRIALTVLVVGGLFSAVTGVVLFETTSQSSFCKSCHIMDPYYESWQRSRHAKVECTACHMPPGLKGKVLTKFQALTQLTKYLTHTWGTKPWGHVADTSCLTCHDLAKLKAETAHSVRPGLKFNHAPHLADEVRHRKLNCTTCHKQVERSVHMQVSMQTCNVCHFKPDPTGQLSRLAECKTCHVPGEVHRQNRFAIPGSEVVVQASQVTADCASCHRKVVDGKGEVPEYRCMQCHNDRGVMKSIGLPNEIHAVHVTKAGADCFNCHTEITHRRPTLAAEPEALNCQQCHGTSHEAQARLFTGKLIGGGTPSGMHRAGLQCASCHVTDLVNGKPKLSLKPSACSSCHSAKLNARYQGWMEGALKLADDLSGRLAQLRTPAAGPAGAKLADELAVELARLKEARPIHNLPHAREVLEDIDRRMRSALPKADAAAVPPLPHTLWSQDRCVSCHFATLAVPTYFRGKPFSHEGHRAHLKEPRCSACHDDGAKVVHGALKNIETCNSCHHQPPPEATKGQKAPICGSCHAPQKLFFGGVVPALGLDVKPIWSSEKTCKDCHGRQGGKPDAPALWAGCTGCHDPGYDTAMKERLKGFAARWDKLAGAGSPALRQLVESDRSGGAHHPALYEKVLDLLEKEKEKR